MKFGSVNRSSSKSISASTISTKDNYPPRPEQAQPVPVNNVKNEADNNNNGGGGGGGGLCGLCACIGGSVAATAIALCCCCIIIPLVVVLVVYFTVIAPPANGASSLTDLDTWQPDEIIANVTQYFGNFADGGSDVTSP